MFKKDLQRTPQERARRAQFSIVARLGACGYLIYLMIQLLQTPKEEQSSLMVTLAIIMMVGAVVVIGITLYDVYVAFKTGRFKPSTYEDPQDSGAISEEADAGDSAAAPDRDALAAYDEDEESGDDDTDEDDPDK